MMVATSDLGCKAYSPAASVPPVSPASTTTSAWLKPEITVLRTIAPEGPGLNPDEPAVIAAIDLVRRELALMGGFGKPECERC
jgi:hypothetical protein